MTGAPYLPGFGRCGAPVIRYGLRSHSRTIAVARRVMQSFLSSDAHQFGLYRSCHDGAAGLGQHVYFAAHAEFGEVDSRFH
jgi:hypothetical protein